MLRYDIHRLESIDRLIRIKGTGTPQCFAKKLGISERTLYEYLAYMKELGAPIEYNKFKGSYYYTEQGGFNFHFQGFS
ncbi:MAG: HTH domain-containing protein [Chitinophagaceae bacterium]|nr:HTH domain-containing protein [Chitinophagaceae bacterium]